MLTAVPMPLTSLQATNAAYNPTLLETLRDFYEGGERFERNKGKYLRKRGSDSVPQWKEARLQCAYYTPHLSGKIDSIIGGILRNPPKFSVPSEGSKSIDPRAAYWHGLSIDADGEGKDLAAVAREALLEIMLPARGYLCICTPDIEAIEGEILETAKMRGRLDCHIKTVPADQIDDWAEDGSWIRSV